MLEPLPTLPELDAIELLLPAFESEDVEPTLLLLPTLLEPADDAEDMFPQLV